MLLNSIRVLFQSSSVNSDELGSISVGLELSGLTPSSVPNIFDKPAPDFCLCAIYVLTST